MTTLLLLTFHDDPVWEVRKYSRGTNVLQPLTFHGSWSMSVSTADRYGVERTLRELLTQPKIIG